MKTFIRYEIQNATDVDYEVIVAFLSDWGIDAFEELEETLVASGIKQAVNEEEIDKYLSEEGIEFKKTEVADQNWNALWEASFEPVILDDFAAIRAGFHSPVTTVSHEIIITPKMSFGTGHHSTTWLMMQFMREINFSGKKVFDFGTGTGVLAILAEKLGAWEVVAIDNDEWSIDNSKENIQNNEARVVKVKLLESPPPGFTFDIVLANINKHILLAQMEGIAGVLAEGGFAILSGLLETDEDDIISSAASNNLIFVKKLEKNGWIALIFAKGLHEIDG